MLFSRFGRVRGAQVLRGEGVELRALRVGAIPGGEGKEEGGAGEARVEHVEQVGSDPGSSNFSVLTKKGEAQAETSCLMLINDAYDVCFPSPLTRSKRMAEIIWGPRKEEMIMDSDMREIDLYAFQGILKYEGKSKFGEAFQQWHVDAANLLLTVIILERVMGTC